MALFDWIRAPRSDLETRASDLFIRSNLLAIASLNPILERHPVLRLGLAIRKHGTQKWDFFMTTAGVFVAMSALECSAAERSRVEGLVFRRHKSTKSSRVSTDLAERLDAERQALFDLWAKAGRAAVDDCAGFVQRAIEDAQPATRADALAAGIGSWVLWNLYGEPPNSDEANLAGAIGYLAMGNFSKYWA